MLQPRLSNDTNDFPGIESAISPRGYVDTARRRAIQQQCGPIDTLKRHKRRDSNLQRRDGSALAAGDDSDD